MIEEKIYNKIEKIDEKLDLYIKEMEGRVSRVEEQIKSQGNIIKVGMAIVSSIVVSFISFII